MSYFAGIDIGGTNVEIGILNESGNILGKKVLRQTQRMVQKIRSKEYGILQKN